jgi:F-type H+-transporting ATPase subunit gamma
MPQSPREILRRIRGIKSTQQITKAMEMVAAVKLNKVRSKAENTRPYVYSMGTIMRALRSSIEEIKHPMFIHREVKKIVLVVTTSDRGLCGTFNANVINAVKTFFYENPGKDISIIAVGRKGYDALTRLGYTIEKYYDMPWGDAIQEKVLLINNHLTGAFKSGSADAVYIIHSHFENVLRYVPITLQHLPIPKLTEEEKKDLLKWPADFIIEPSFDEVAEQLIPRYLETQLYHCLTESLASEYAARMVSMRNANDNAEEVIEELTLSYNKARQASITRELIDIIGGVEAMSG